MLTLHYHPLASFCWKALIPLYEKDLAFERVVVDLGNAQSRADFAAIWPMAKFPVLVDDAAGATVAESSAIIEYLDIAEPRMPMVPTDATLRWQARMWESVFDSYLHEPMQRIVADALRPEASRDPMGVEQARGLIRQAYDLLEARMAGRDWCVGAAFGLADVAACPALFYADTVEPMGERLVSLAAYRRRLEARPSFARVLDEATPFFRYFPLEPKPRRTAS